MADKYDELLKKLDELKEQTNTFSDSTDTDTLIPKKQWYQFSDIFTRQDEILEAILLQLQKMESTLATQPPTPTPVQQPPQIPAEFGGKFDSMINLLSLIFKNSEGYGYITGASNLIATGTQQEVVSTIKTYLVIIRANITNTGTIYLGGRGVSGVTGYQIDAGEAVALQINNVKKSIWMDGTVAGDGISWIALVD